MNPFRANFGELCRRHLCRHSQLGLNVWHLIAVLGVYLALYGVAFALPGGPWIVGLLLAAYFVVLAFNIPPAVLLLDMLLVGGLLLAFLALPAVPAWGHLLMLVFWHRFQVWQHRIYDHSHDMDEFAGKYRKGFALFVLLAIYELPILLDYLVFDGRKRHAREPSDIVRA